MSASLVPLLFALAVQRPVRASDSVPPPRSIAQLETRIRDVLTRTHTTAIGIALVSRDSVLWVTGLGKADAATGRDATGETLFRIGSTSKAFVSLLVLMEEQAGKLHLDDPVRQYVPEIGFENRWETTDPVRIVHLLVATQPKHREVHLICDNLSAHKTKAVRAWLTAHPRVTLHYTPTYASWLNQVELWFAKIERDLIARGIFTSVADLRRKLLQYIRAHNTTCHPFLWTYRNVHRRIHANAKRVTVH